MRRHKYPPMIKKIFFGYHSILIHSSECIYHFERHEVNSNTLKLTVHTEINCCVLKREFDLDFQVKSTQRASGVGACLVVMGVIVQVQVYRSIRTPTDTCTRSVRDDAFS